MSKDTINVKSNGLRNELKEIRKSIDKLTLAMVEMVDIMAQTHKHDEKNYHINDSSYHDDGKLWNATSTNDYAEKQI